MSEKRKAELLDDLVGFIGSSMVISVLFKIADIVYYGGLTWRMF